MLGGGLLFSFSFFNQSSWSGILSARQSECACPERHIDCEKGEEIRKCAMINLYTPHIPKQLLYICFEMYLEFLTFQFWHLSIQTQSKNIFFISLKRYARYFCSIQLKYFHTRQDKHFGHEHLVMRLKLINFIAK